MLVSSEKLVTKPGATPMKIDDYVWSDDNKQLLIFTNTKKVWRLNTPRRLLGPGFGERPPEEAGRRRSRVIA